MASNGNGPMTNNPTDALPLLAQIKAHAHAGAEALEALNRAIAALEATLQGGVEGAFKGGFNAPSNGKFRGQPRGKIEADPELQAFIRARVMTLTFPELAAAVTANFPPERRVAMSSIHRWWHRTGKHKEGSIGKS